MIYILFLFISLTSVRADPASYAEGKRIAESLDKGVQNSIPESVKDVNKDLGMQPDHVSEGNYLENFHQMGEHASNKTNNSNEGSYLLESQKTCRAQDYRVTADSEVIKNANEIVASPMKYIGGEENRTEGQKHEVIETRHVCEESSEEVKYTCEETRTVKLRERTLAEYELNFWYQPWEVKPMLNMNIITDTMLYGNFWDDPGSPKAKDMHGGVSNPFPSDLRDRIQSIKLKSPLTKPCGGSGRMTFDEKGNFYYRGGCGSGFHNRKYVGTAIISYVPKLSEEDLIEDINDACAGHEQQATKGLCRYGEQEILEGPETRQFCSGNECITVTRDWWKRRLTYHCKYPSKDNCTAFRSAGCDQIESECLEHIDDVCVNNKKTFLCRSIALGNGQVRFIGDVPFCLDGNCDDHHWAGNQDFADVMSKLSVFKEMSKDLSAENATVFRGHGASCSKSTLNFQDCCGSSGWGRSVGLSQSCKAEEKNLKKEREANKCVQVGTYCAHKERITNICLMKKTSFCCFPSKLSRIVQEQGRRQLGINWGDAETPECRALTIDEIQRIDFGKIDFSSLYEEIRAKTNVESVSKAAEGMGGRWTEKVKAAQSIHGENVRASEIYNKKGNPDASL